jgi:hypothetical protein
VTLLSVLGTIAYFMYKGFKLRWLALRTTMYLRQAGLTHNPTFSYL